MNGMTTPTDFFFFLKAGIGTKKGSSATEVEVGMQDFKANKGPKVLPVNMRCLGSVICLTGG